MTTSLSIQQAAAVTGLSVHTLRYYERIGLLDPIRREDNSHRRFNEEDLRWIDFLRKLKTTGLPIRDMLRYAELRRLGNTRDSVSARKAMLQQHTLAVQQTLIELQSNLTVLHQKIAMYDALEATTAQGVPPQSTEDVFHEYTQHSDTATTTNQGSNSGRHSPTRR